MKRAVLLSPRFDPGQVAFAAPQRASTQAAVSRTCVSNGVGPKPSSARERVSSNRNGRWNW